MEEQIVRCGISTTVIHNAQRYCQSSVIPPPSPLIKIMASSILNPILTSLTNKMSRSLRPPNIVQNANPIRICKHPYSSQIITSLLSKGANWETLSAKLSAIKLTDTLVQNILLNFKEPPDAKKALTFFHWSSHCQNFKHGLRSYSIIVHILVRAGLFTDAKALLESSVSKNLSVQTVLDTYELVLPGPNVFDVLVQTYARMRMVEAGYDACRFLGDNGHCVSLNSFNLLLHVAQRAGKSQLAWMVYEYMILRRVYPNNKTVEIMVDLMSKDGSLKKMIDVLDRIHGKRCGPGIVVNLSLGLRVVRDDRVEDAIVLMKRLLQNDLMLDDVMNSLVLHGYCKMGKLELAYEVYDDLVNRGLGSNAFVHTSFIEACCKEGKIEEALKLMDEMVAMNLKPYDDTYNFLIECCSKLGRLDNSIGLLEKMVKKRFMVAPVACNEMIVMLCDAGKVEKANEILTDIMDKGFTPNNETYSKLMDGYGKIGKSDDIVKLYYEMEHNGHDIGLMVYISLIKNLQKCGKLKEADKFTTVMKEKYVK